MAVDWLASLPQTPLLNGFGSSFEDAQIASQTATGPGKARPRFTKIPQTRDVSYCLDLEQFQLWDDFYHLSLNGGVETLIWPDPDGGTLEVQIIGEPVLGEVTDGCLVLRLSLLEV